MVAKRKIERPRSIATKITKGGQITLPAEARVALDVKPGDKVYVRIEKGEVRILKPKYTLAEVLGSLKAPRPDFDIDEAIREAKEDMAEHVMRTMGGK